MDRPAAICILGAGFSHIAGLPLASQLLTSQVYVASDKAFERHRSVWEDYEAWEAEKGGPTEIYLSDLYARRHDWPGAALWRNAVELLAATLATPRAVDRVSASPRYVGRVTYPVRNGTHDGFWDVVLSMTNLRGVVTTNYDTLAERGLRHRPTKRPFRPGFYYGGFPRPQILQGAASPFARPNRERYVELAGSVPVFKLHGSLNWSASPPGIKMYQDMRPAFRRGGDALIAPPLLQEQLPPWSSPIWEEAGKALEGAALWIVVGYSLPSYDAGVRALLARVGGARQLSIVILDPLASELTERWLEVIPQARVLALAGLPSGVDDLIGGLQSATTPSLLQEDADHMKTVTQTSTPPARQPTSAKGRRG